MRNRIAEITGPSTAHFVIRTLGFGLLSIVLVACSGQAPATQTATKPSVSVSPSPADVRPSPEPGESQGPIGGPAFVPDAGVADRAPLVLREGAAANPVPVEPASFSDEAVYTDGVVAAMSNFSRGVVQGEGVGMVVGADYVVFTVAVRNGSARELDLSAVVPSMFYGEDKLAAAPLYGEVETSDLTGSLHPGESAEARYAFLLPAETAETVLFLDLNGSHEPLEFRGDLP